MQEQKHNEYTISINNLDQNVASLSLPITLTASVVQKVAKLIASEGEDDLMLRISIMGGGCSGLQYCFAFTKDTKAGDTILLAHNNHALESTKDTTKNQENHATEYVFPICQAVNAQQTCTTYLVTNQKNYAEKIIAACINIEQIKDLHALPNLNDLDSWITFCIDKFSIQYLTDATIDYQHGVQGEQFVIKNPNAKTTCGCGSSFDT